MIGSLLLPRDNLPRKAEDRIAISPGPRGRCSDVGDRIDYSFFPREECMALAGTNQDYKHCGSYPPSHAQSCLLMVPIAQHTIVRLVFGTGKWDGCSIYRQFLWKFYSSASIPVGPSH